MKKGKKKRGAGRRPARRAPKVDAIEQTMTGQASNDYSVNALSKLLGNDRRTIDKAVQGIPPTRIEGKTKFYRLADVEAALKEKKNNKVRDLILLEELRKLRNANDKTDGVVVAKAKVVDSIRRCMAPAAAALEQRLVNEYPTAVAGLDVPQARIYGKRLCDELIGFFLAMEKEWAF